MSMPKISFPRNDLSPYLTGQLNSKVDLGKAKQKTRQAYLRIQNWRRHLMIKSGQHLVQKYLIYLLSLFFYLWNLI